MEEAEDSEKSRRDIMIKKYQAGQNRWVMATDEPDIARELYSTMPVIGITGSEPDYGLWFGLPYLVWDEKDIDNFFIRRVWSRYYAKALVLLRGSFYDRKSRQKRGFAVREMKEKDLPDLKRLYQDEDVKHFLAHPTKGDESDEAWESWFRAYCKEIYAADGPAMWVVASPDDKFLGRIGLEWQSFCNIEGYFLGYALLPESRGSGYVCSAAGTLMEQALEYWGIEQVYAACHKTNQASAVCAERLGFKMIYEDKEFFVFSRFLLHF